MQHRMRGCRREPRSPGSLPSVSERVGIFGGTFDPIHSAHIAAAKAVRNTLELDRVLLIPAGLGETLDIGRDTGVAVTQYQQALGVYSGEIAHVRIILGATQSHGGH